MSAAKEFEAYGSVVEGLIVTSENKRHPLTTALGSIPGAAVYIILRLITRQSTDEIIQDSAEYINPRKSVLFTSQDFLYEVV